MFIGQLKSEKKIFATTPGFFFPPLDQSSSTFDIQTDFSPHQNYMRGKRLESKTLDKLGGSPHSSRLFCVRLYV